MTGNGRISYLDSSALVKAYVEERGSEWVRSLIEEGSIVASMLVLTEVASAFGRRAQEGSLTADQHVLLFREFLADAIGFDLVPVTEELLLSAADSLLHAVVAPLRTLDAVHLATVRQSFILARESGDAEPVFVSADRRLLVAAKSAGLEAENPEEHP